MVGSQELWSKRTTTTGAPTGFGGIYWWNHESWSRYDAYLWWSTRHLAAYELPWLAGQPFEKTFGDSIFGRENKVQTFISGSRTAKWVLVTPPPRKLTWQWKKNHHLKMYLLLRRVIFHGHFSLLEGNLEDTLCMIFFVYPPGNEFISHLCKRKSFSQLSFKGICDRSMQGIWQCVSKWTINHPRKKWCLGKLVGLP